MIDETHICIITSSNIFKDAIGGEAKYSIQLHNWLKQNGFKSTLLGHEYFTVKVFNSGENYGAVNTIKKQPKNRISINFYPFFMGYKLVVSLIMSAKILRIHLRSPISLIHSQDTGYSGLTALLIGKLLRIPVVISSHGIRHKTIQHSLHSKIKKILVMMELNLDKFTIKMADEVIADNETIRKYLERLVKRRIESIPIPIQLDQFRYSLSNRKSIREELGCDDDTKILGYVGRFSPEKNLLTLLSAFAMVIQKYPQAKLVLVGSGKMELEMKNYITKLKMTDNIIFCGVRQDVHKILSSFDVFILPSFIEGMSIALLEAMATSSAIICSNISTNTETISHRKDGILVDPNNVIEIEKAIIQLFEDGLLREELRYNASKKANQFGIDIVFHNVIELYKGILGKSF